MMFKARKLCPYFQIVSFLLVSFLIVVGDGLFQECSTTEVNSDIWYCDVRVGLKDSGHIISPGTEEHGVYGNNASQLWFVSLEDPSTQQLYVCPAYLDLSVGDVIVVYDVLEVLLDRSFRTSSVSESYWGEGLIPRDRVAIQELMSMPCKVPTTGMLLINFTSTASDPPTGFDLIFFAKSRDSAVPTTGVAVSVAQFVKQMVIPEATAEFTVQVEEGSRIWLQVIFMNLTSNVEDIMHTGHCKANPYRLEIRDKNCSKDDCSLAVLCRNPFRMSPVTLVSVGNFIIVRIFCHQDPNFDCAIINFKTYDPTLDIGGCPQDADTNYIFTALKDEQTNFTHSFDLNSASTEKKIWWLENIHNSVTRMSVTENSLGISPDCVTERVEIFSGRCIRPENLVSYFCGGTRDTIKLTTSPYIAIRFTGYPHAATAEGRLFKLMINAVLSPPVRPPPPVVDYTSERKVSTNAAFIALPMILLVILIFLPAAIRVVEEAKKHANMIPTDRSMPTIQNIDLEAVKAPLLSGMDEYGDKAPPYPGTLEESPDLADQTENTVVEQISHQPQQSFVKEVRIPSITSFENKITTGVSKVLAETASSSTSTPCFHPTPSPPMKDHWSLKSESLQSLAEGSEMIVSEKELSAAAMKATQPGLQTSESITYSSQSLVPTTPEKYVGLVPGTYSEPTYVFPAPELQEEPTLSLLEPAKDIESEAEEQLSVPKQAQKNESYEKLEETHFVAASIAPQMIVSEKELSAAAMKATQPGPQTSESITYSSQSLVPTTPEKYVGLVAGTSSEPTCVFPAPELQEEPTFSLLEPAKDIESEAEEPLSVPKQGQKTESYEKLEETHFVAASIAPQSMSKQKVQVPVEVPLAFPFEEETLIAVEVVKPTSPSPIKTPSLNTAIAVKPTLLNEAEPATIALSSPLVSSVAPSTTPSSQAQEPTVTRKEDQLEAVSQPAPGQHPHQIPGMQASDKSLDLVPAIFSAEDAQSHHKEIDEIAKLPVEVKKRRKSSEKSTGSDKKASTRRKGSVKGKDIGAREKKKSKKK